MALADKRTILCSTCKRKLDDESAPTTVRRVVVGIQHGGDSGQHKWIVRAFCPTCAESHYHTLVYGQGFRG